MMIPIAYLSLQSKNAVSRVLKIHQRATARGYVPSETVDACQPQELHS